MTNVMHGTPRVEPVEVLGTQVEIGFTEHQGTDRGASQFPSSTTTLDDTIPEVPQLARYLPKFVLGTQKSDCTYWLTDHLRLKWAHSGRDSTSPAWMIFLEMESLLSSLLASTRVADLGLLSAMILTCCPP